MSPLHRWGNWGTEKWSNLPQVPQLLGIFEFESSSRLPDLQITLKPIPWFAALDWGHRGFRNSLSLRPGTWTARPCPSAPQCSSNPTLPLRHLCGTQWIQEIPSGPLDWKTPGFSVPCTWLTRQHDIEASISQSSREPLKIQGMLTCILALQNVPNRKCLFRAVLRAAKDGVCYIIQCLPAGGPGEASFSGLYVKDFSWPLVYFSLRDSLNPLTHCGCLDILASGQLSSSLAAESQGVYWLCSWL